MNYVFSTYVPWDEREDSHLFIDAMLSDQNCRLSKEKKEKEENINKNEGHLKYLNLRIPYGSWRTKEYILSLIDWNSRFDLCPRFCRPSINRCFTWDEVPLFRGLVSTFFRSESQPPEKSGVVIWLIHTWHKIVYMFVVYPVSPFSRSY